MLSKKTKINAICSLSLLAFSILFTLLLMVIGVFSESIRSANDTNDAFSVGCGATILIVIIGFTLVVRSVTALLGFGSMFTKKNLPAILTLGVFTTIFAVLSIIGSIFVFYSYLPLADSNSYATVVKITLLANIVLDLYWLVSIILNTISTSKYAKSLPKESK